MNFEQRINHLQEVIRDRQLTGAILFYSRDIYYYTGTSQPAYLVVLPDDYRLFVRRGYDIASRESGLPAERLCEERNPQAIMARMFPGPGTGEQVGTELDMLTVPHAQSLSRGLGARELVDISPEVLQQRSEQHSVKVATQVSAGEQRDCAPAARITGCGFFRANALGSMHPRHLVKPLAPIIHGPVG